MNMSRLEFIYILSELAQNITIHSIIANEDARVEAVKEYREKYEVSNIKRSR